MKMHTHLSLARVNNNFATQIEQQRNRNEANIYFKFGRNTQQKKMLKTNLDIFEIDYTKPSAQIFKILGVYDFFMNSTKTRKTKLIRRNQRSKNAYRIT